MKNTRPPVPREIVIQREGLALMRSYGIMAYRRNTGAFSAAHQGKRRYVKFSEPGQSDAWGIMPDGRHLEVEFKRPGQRPTMEQVLWLTQCNERCPAFWVDSCDILALVITGLLDGRRIVYHDTQRRYGQVWGPSGDYDLE